MRCIISMHQVVACTVAAAVQARLHPEQPANTITREDFECLWRHSTHLLQRGYVTGSILTVDSVDAARLGPPWTRRYVYNHKRCGFCKGPVKSWDMAARTVYACLQCQQLRKDTKLTPARTKAMADAGIAKEFVSHCAIDVGTTLTPAKMTVKQLTAALQACSSLRTADLHCTQTWIIYHLPSR